MWTAPANAVAADPNRRNVNGEFYPTGADVVPKMIDLLAQQVAAPVQFVKGLRNLYNAGARVFVEVGPKKACKVLPKTFSAAMPTYSRCSPIIPSWTI